MSRSTCQVLGSSTRSRARKQKYVVLIPARRRLYGTWLRDTTPAILAFPPVATVDDSQRHATVMDVRPDRAHLAPASTKRRPLLHHAIEPRVESLAAATCCSCAPSNRPQISDRGCQPPLRCVKARRGRRPSTGRDPARRSSDRAVPIEPDRGPFWLHRTTIALVGRGVWG
jgi:hypothetical protein